MTEKRDFEAEARAAGWVTEKEAHGVNVSRGVVHQEGWWAPDWESAVKHGKPPEQKERYLGDGLYASWDGYQIKLRAPRGDRDDVVYLEPSVQVALARVMEDIVEGKMPVS